MHQVNILSNVTTIDDMERVAIQVRKISLHEDECYVDYVQHYEKGQLDLSGREMSGDSAVV